nr:iron chelate uptake ABC transporter family permease subunit [Piscibacillus salipiscarius]
MKNRHSLWLWIPVFLIILMAMMSLSVTLGAANITWQLVWQIILSNIPGFDQLIGETWDTSTETIVWNIRLPRVLLGAAVGAALALAGAIYQGVLRNPLADPFILGVSSGASFGAALVIVFGLQTLWLGQFTLPAVAFYSAL